MKTASCNLVGVLVASVLAGSLAACGSKPPPPPPPTAVALTFVAAPDVNPDPSGRASPIFVRYYQLATTNGFDNTDYFQIHDKEAALLGPALLDRQDLSLAPSATREVDFEAKPGTKFIGFIASYRDIDHAAWRAAVAIPPNKTTKIKIGVKKLALSVSAESK